MNKILIIEDSIVARAQLLDILAEQYTVVTAATGGEGLSLSRIEDPAAILLDVGLPDMDGYEVCRRLKADPATLSMPVLFITAMDAPEEKVRGFEAGAEDYIVKPFFPAELLARVKVHIDLCCARRQAVELERLKLFREMAVALSHEINNPLTTIYGNLHLLSRDIESGSNEAALINDIRSNMERIKTVIAKLARASHASTISYHDTTSMIDFTLL